MLGHFRRSFITGLFLLVPLAITYLVLRFLFDTVDGILRPLLQDALRRAGLGDMEIPGIGLVALIILIYLAGIIGARVLGRQLINFGQGLLLRVPVINMVYSASKQLIDSFSSEQRTGFKRVVMLEYPREGMWAIGFLTSVTTDEAGKTMGFVYIPTAPTPQSGWVALLPVEDIYDTDLSVGEAFRMVLSGGIASPRQIVKRPLTNWANDMPVAQR